MCIFYQWPIFECVSFFPRTLIQIVYKKGDDRLVLVPLLLFENYCFTPFLLYFGFTGEGDPHNLSNLIVL